MAALNFPTSPSVNQTYTANNKTWKWDGTTWVYQGAGNVPNITIATTAPSSPNAGDLWWKSDDGTMKIYYNDGSSSQWVDAFPTQVSTDVVAGAQIALLRVFG